MHRLVLYESLGPEPRPCHWCGKELLWITDRFAPNALQVDHLNQVRDDNRVENLVPACQVCNVRRAAALRHQVLMERGLWARNNTIERLGKGRGRGV